MQKKIVAGIMLYIGIAPVLIMFGLILVPLQQSLAQQDDSGCLVCHDGLLDIREEGSVMLATLNAKGVVVGSGVVWFLRRK